METVGNDGDGKKDLDDSGCVQDVGPPPTDYVEDRPPGLLDLCDDVLLYILRYCPPRELKALGFTCPRLGRLVRDRTLWTRVDARAQRTGRARLRWLLAHALSPATTELLLEGYAREARGCLGHVKQMRQEVEDESAQVDKDDAAASTSGVPRNEPRVQIITVDPLTRLHHLMRPNSHGGLHTPSRFGDGPAWPEEVEPPRQGSAPQGSAPVGACPGPQFTLTQCMLRQMRVHCALTSLALQYCNINCDTTGIAHFPPTLKKLSLKGSKCYNLPLDKSFLFNIQDYLPELEDLDLSECEWLEPASLLPLSKVPALERLVMRDCYRLSEFVAYASLAARYGFRRLKILDVSGSPVADSEVSAFGWLPALTHLHLAPPAPPPPARDHAHYCRDPPPAADQLEPWESEEPEYFKIKPQIIEPMATRPNMTIEDIEDQIEQLRDYENNICLHGTEYNLCMEGIRVNTPRKRPFEADPSEPTSAPPAKKEMFEPSTSSGKIPKGNSGDNTTEEKKMNGESKVPEKEPAASGSDKSKNDHKETDDPGPSSKKQRAASPEPKDETPSCSSKPDEDTTTSSTKTPKSKTKDSDVPADPDGGSARVKIVNSNDVNAGASTSKSPPGNVVPPSRPNISTCRNSQAHPNNCNCNGTIEYVRFRQNMEPVIVTRDRSEMLRGREREDRERPHVGNLIFTPPTPHLDASSLVTDSAVRRFGRADVEDVNVIHIGPRPGPGDLGARPNRSSLQVLSITGYRNITDRSLMHLATAAPDLRMIDFSETGVTAQGVENFRSLRPDCEVKYSEYTHEEDEDGN